jgi:hypothetical protein
VNECGLRSSGCRLSVVALAGEFQFDDEQLEAGSPIKRQR